MKREEIEALLKEITGKFYQLSLQKKKVQHFTREREMNRLEGQIYILNFILHNWKSNQIVTITEVDSKR